MLFVLHSDGGAERVYVRDLFPRSVRVLLSVGAAGWSWFSGLKPCANAVAHLLHLVGDIPASVLSTSRRQQHSDAYSDANAHQHPDRIVPAAALVAANPVGQTADPVCRCLVRVFRPVSDIVQP